MTNEAALALATSPRAAAPGTVIQEKIPTAAAVGDLETATAQTVAKMCEYIDAGARDSIVRAWAAQAINMYGCGRDDAAMKVWAVFWLVKHAVEYVHDEPRLQRLGEGAALDLLIAPAVLVRTRKPKEDCDGFTMLICAMLRALLVECYIVTVAADPSDPSRWSHVFALAKLDDGSYMAVDGSHGAFPGWMVPAEHVFRWQAWGLNGREANDVKMPRFRGLHGYARRGSRMGLRGLGDCVNFQVGPDGNCPDGSPYTGVLDSGGTAPTTTPKPTTSAFNWDATIAGLLNSGVGIAKSVLTPPTYQSSYNPATGQTTTTIRGANAVGSAAMPLGLGLSSNTLLIGGVVVVGILIAVSMSKGGR